MRWVGCHVGRIGYGWGSAWLPGCLALRIDPNWSPCLKAPVSRNWCRTISRGAWCRLMLSALDTELLTSWAREAFPSRWWPGASPGPRRRRCGTRGLGSWRCCAACARASGRWRRRSRSTGSAARGPERARGSAARSLGGDPARAAEGLAGEAGRAAPRVDRPGRPAAGGACSPRACGASGVRRPGGSVFLLLLRSLPFPVRCQLWRESRGGGPSRWACPRARGGWRGGSGCWRSCGARSR